MFGVYITKVITDMFYMYIFTPICFQNHKSILDHIYDNLINIYRVQVCVYGYAWMRMGILLHNIAKTRYV